MPLDRPATEGAVTLASRGTINLAPAPTRPDFFKAVHQCIASKLVHRVIVQRNLRTLPPVHKAHGFTLHCGNSALPPAMHFVFELVIPVFNCGSNSIGGKLTSGLFLSVIRKMNDYGKGLPAFDRVVAGLD